MGSKKPAKPKVKYPGIHPSWSGGTWKFLARFRGGMETVYGAARDTQIEASNDYRKLCENQEMRTFRAIKTLGKGIAAARLAAIERNLAPSTIKSHFGESGGSHAQYLLTWWKPETPLKLLNARTIAKMVRAAAEGRWCMNSPSSGSQATIVQAIAQRQLSLRHEFTCPSEVQDSLPNHQLA